VEIVKKICATPNHGSIGIITFNATQKDYIDDLLFAVTDQKVRAELNRKNKNDGSDESIFVKNIENVQGDERDIIIFSNTYAKTATGKFAQFYGPINQKGGENRINVAISRAREKIYIVKSFESSAILRKGVVPKGKMVFGDYLEFCEQFDKLKTLNHPTIHEIFGRYNESKIINKKKDLAFEFASVFDEQVCNSLSKKINKKYEVVANVEQSGYKLDICVKDRASGAYVLAVKCDGYPYESSVSLKERDYYRQNYLEIRG
jgi:superfamily I DNA and/or RNA helicase